MTDAEPPPHPTRAELEDARLERIHRAVRETERPVFLAQVATWFFSCLALAAGFAAYTIGNTFWGWLDEQSWGLFLSCLFGLATLALAPLGLAIFIGTQVTVLRHLADLRYLQLRLDESVERAVYRWATGGSHDQFARALATRFILSDELRAELAEERAAVEQLISTIELLLEHFDGTDNDIKTLGRYRELFAAFIKVIDEYTERQTKLDRPAEFTAEVIELKRAAEQAIAAE
jgi:hypothetical protein